jgi:magnesium chelatase subunit I
VPGRRLAAEHGDDLLVAWRHRDERYAEKLATPDTSVGDLVGDIDPTKVARDGRWVIPRPCTTACCPGEPWHLRHQRAARPRRADPGRVVQRAGGARHPDRGYALRLPLDLLLIASANPEDYTNRGAIITPLKDRFGAEIRTHYPLDTADEVALIDQEAAVVAPVPTHVVEVVARFAAALRSSSAVDQRSGVSARLAIAAVKPRPPPRCGAARSPARTTGRAGQRPSGRPPHSAWQGRVRDGRGGREDEVLQHLLRLATAETFRARLAGVDLSAFTAPFGEGGTLETGVLVPAGDVLEQLGPSRGWPPCWTGSAWRRRRSPRPGRRSRRAGARGPAPDPALSKDEVDGRTVYGS